jgi:hypothetical protein
MKRGDSGTMKVTNAAEWAAVNELLDDFHDGTVKELYLDMHEWVGADGWLHYGGGGSAIVVVHLQGSPPRSARLKFERVFELSLDYDVEASPSCAEPAREGTWVAEFLSCRVRGRECVITLTDELGPGPFLRPED